MQSINAILSSNVVFSTENTTNVIHLSGRQNLDIREILLFLQTINRGRCSSKRSYGSFLDDLFERPILSLTFEIRLETTTVLLGQNDPAYLDQKITYIHPEAHRLGWWWGGGECGLYAHGVTPVEESLCKAMPWRSE